MNNADITAVLGASGMGKSYNVKQALKKNKQQQLVWDFKREYAKQGYRSTDRIAEFISQANSGEKKLAFMPSMNEKQRIKQFDLYCRFVYARGGLTAVVEELAFVTRPNFAPDSWRLLTMTGRHEGITIIGTAQRPASIDKDFLGNCSMVRSFRLGYKSDARAVADVFCMDKQNELLELPKLSYIERPAGGVLKRGKMRKVKGYE